MPILVLEDAEVPGDVVERLARLRLDAAGREGAGADPAAVRRVEVRRQKAEILAVLARWLLGILPSAFCLLPFARGMLCRACNTTSNNQPGGTA